MICYETIRHEYVIRGCKHTMCSSCATTIRDASDVTSDVNFNSTWDIEIPGKKTRIKCPMCRQVEPGMALDDFEKQYPEGYDTLRQLEFHIDEKGDSYFYTSINSNQIKTTYYVPKLRSPHLINNKTKQNKVMRKRNQLR
jgi:hypothetical protein